MYSAVVLLIVIAGAQNISYDDVERVEWNAYKLEYGKDYSKEEDLRRFQIFKDNKYIFDKHNKLFATGEESYELGVNEFADMTEEEFVERMTVKKGLTTNFEGVPIFEAFDNFEAPDEMDWSNVTLGVKNQGDCGSCFIFAVVATVESHHAIKNTKKVSLSEQQVLDCVGPPSICKWGATNPLSVLEYIIRAGINSDESYPYEGKEGRCRFKPGKIKAKVLDFRATGNIGSVQGNVKAFKNAIALNGPIAVIMSVPIYIKSYVRGIIDHKKCPDNETARHTMAIIGYGTERRKEYWRVKNSWGRNWGEKGFVRIVRNKNMCGIEKNPALFPIVQKM